MALYSGRSRRGPRVHWSWPATTSAGNDQGGLEFSTARHAGADGTFRLPVNERAGWLQKSYSTLVKR